MNLITQRIMLAAVALSASALITACGAHSTGQATETFTVYEDAPKMSLLDLGAPGNKQQCRVDAIAALTELENEPKCLGSVFPIRGPISIILS
jgi:hypothetical protein